MAKAVKEMPIPYVKYHNGFTKAMKVIAPQHAQLEGERSEMPHITFIYGRQSGTGKSAMSSTWPGPVYYVDKPTGQGTYWFDDYIPLYHQTVVFEEFRGSDCKFDYLLRLLDRKPMRVQYKGGTTQFNSPYLVFNSNVRHDKLYPKLFQEFPQQVEALTRRLTAVVAFIGVRAYNVLRGELPENVYCPELAPPNLAPIVYPEEEDEGVQPEHLNPLPIPGRSYYIRVNNWTNPGEQGYEGVQRIGYPPAPPYRD